MLEKVGHVRNPLTIVAIFAALVEVSGTAVLPLLDPQTQRIYIWFLMGFPTLLLAAFFATLNWNHTVFYAPSDFQDQKDFLKFVKAQQSFIDYKLDEEIREAERETRVAEMQVTEEPDELTSTIKVDSEPRRSDLDKLRYSTENPREAAELAHTLALGRFERERNILLVRRVAPAGMPNLVFDAAVPGDSPTTLVEVKYTRSGSYPFDFIRMSFDRVHTYWNALPPDAQRELKVVLILVIGLPDADNENSMKKSVEAIAMKYPFRVEVVVYALRELNVLHVGSNGVQ